MLLPFLAEIKDSIFILEDEFWKGELCLALCPESLAADKQSGFTSGPLSPELTLYQQKAPVSKESVSFVTVTYESSGTLLTKWLAHEVSPP